VNTNISCATNTTNRVLEDRSLSEIHTQLQ